MTVAYRLLRIALPACLAVAASPALAQSGNDAGKEGWIVTVGGGGVLQPRFPGGQELELRPWPLFDVRRVGTQAGFATPDQSFGISVINGVNFRVGPALNIASGRDEEDAIPGIGDVGTTIEGGAFAEAYMSESARFRAEVRKGFGGHKGLIADLGADYVVGSPNEGTHFSIGPRLRLANARYVRAFYGINPTQSELTGLPVHDVDGGLHSAGALAFAGISLGGRLGLRAYGRYDRLLGDAADSPLVLSSVGSRNQFELGLGLTYSFTVR
ncbi:MAG TPA: MipA/OmpV family protein [Allosphingosinicella sp.]|nr:MipA/OmpV family protein [Allosphingosinicella sp.]